MRQFASPAVTASAYGHALFRIRLDTYLIVRFCWHRRGLTEFLPVSSTGHLICGFAVGYPANRRRSSRSSFRRVRFSPCAGNSREAVAVVRVWDAIRGQPLRRNLFIAFLPARCWADLQQVINPCCSRRFRWRARSSSAVCNPVAEWRQRRGRDRAHRRRRRDALDRRIKWAARRRSPRAGTSRSGHDHRRHAVRHVAQGPRPSSRSTWRSHAVCRVRYEPEERDCSRATCRIRVGFAAAFVSAFLCVRGCCATWPPRLHAFRCTASPSAQ